MRDQNSQPEQYKSEGSDKYNELIKRYVKSLDWLRSEFLEMDDLAGRVMGETFVMGIADWDDSVCVKFKDHAGGCGLVVSTDGPYTKRLVMKSALIHASTDVIVKGAKPLFALDTLIGSKEEIRDMALSLKRQALSMKIPILGGNTMFEEGAKPRCNLTVIGKLFLKEPIRDCTAKKNDILALVGEPIWGTQDERISKAKNQFGAWFDILDEVNSGRINIHAAKDVTKGGLISTVHEIAEKSGLDFDLESFESIPFSITRNLDNFLVSVSDDGYEKIFQICKKKGCSICKVGRLD